MSADPKLDEIRKEHDLGHVLTRDQIRYLLDAQSTIGGWACRLHDIDQTGVPFWSQEPLEPGFVGKHAGELSRLAHLVAGEGGGAILLVHGWLCASISKISGRPLPRVTVALPMPPVHSSYRFRP